MASAADPGDSAALPSTIDSHLKPAALRGETGAIAEAIPRYEAALRLRLDDATSHHDLGAALIAAGRIAEAPEHLETALRLDPTTEAACSFLRRLPPR